MVADQFPGYRLATLLARQLSSPIATRIKEYAKSHPHFGRSVCMRSGRAAAAAELRCKMWALRLSPRRAPRAALSDERALEAGADLLGEMILFSLGAFIVTFEFNRQATKQEEKAAAERAARRELLRRAGELRRELLRHQQRLDRLAAALQPLRGPASAAETPPAPETHCQCPCPEPMTDPPL